ncbi:glycoside hydrolase [Pseudomonas sp. B2M1-30]|uniref:glycoside hydrolase n=1 Tax=Pseudomonas TaxID=286 RepID=UPI0021C81D81|nr:MULTISPECIES: glycoside hydrolase [Pseudomonas]MCU0118393.1 glycoside hydrolase [Pseudomonas sp. B2M1-30]MCU7259569.1 glycoside hydrolase [Pseudomonas koreensis]
MQLFHRVLRYALFACAGLSSSWVSAGTVLENPLWRVELDPATLSIRVTPAQEKPVQASAGVDPHTVSRLTQSATHADWQWDDGAWTLSARLDQRDLSLSIRARDPGELSFLRQPGSAMGKGLIWALAEGHYVPAGDARWQGFLLDQGEFNTTQDLSLPLWGVDHGRFTLNWMLSNSYNNRLSFSADGKALALAARHQFTSLDPRAALTFTLSLGDADPLAGAKRYRQWLIDNRQYEPLSDKLRKTPEAKKLLGASHVYLWGNDLLGPADVRSWPALLKRLGSTDALASELRGSFDAETLQILSRAKAPLDRYQQTTLLRGLNAALNQRARSGWQAVAEPDMQALADGYGRVRGEVAKTFADALITTPERWGSTLSPVTIEQLQAAGLTRLWLGLGEGWEGGLWHPETVRQGVAAGYLLAPYDSYETALTSTENPDWTTAHLGARANLECAVVLSSGAFKSGFQQSGHYTRPQCVRPLLEARIKAVQARAGFNSWFLDAYATGMLFDSYGPGATMTQAQNAEGNVDASRWVNETLQLPAGSEDGNATTARGVLFAHGMQTPVIGWGDPDMSKNPKSPYYVGRWFPNERPEVFFKTVPLKEPYRTVHFAPQTRLPLYQAVFHGSVITTHHWLFDSLKLSNVRVENELTQLLYNVPPLYHLSADTLQQRLPLIARQDAFFRPLHERLATQALTGFQWLSEDRQVQQTTFADGTRLLANFAAQAREVQGLTLPGQSITVRSAQGKSSYFQIGAQP